ncbi:MAG: BamA/TamA family outer membrane protein [Deltaproteobacteria bacterium]|jgi:hypothetical protein|nr:BamA/TamA family outer membrane protein [Deltaproteobacteria bacterium]
MRNLYRFILGLAVCIVFLLPISTFAEEEKDPSNEPVVTITPPQQYIGRKIAFFPLDLPGYLMRAVTWPIGAVIRTVEEKHLGARIFDLLSNKEKTFWVYPYIEGAPGPGFGGGLGFVHKDLFHDDWRLSGRYDIRINLNQYARLGLGKKHLLDLAGRPLSFRFDFYWAHEGYNDYYGIGENSTQANHATYASDYLRGKFKFDYALTKKINMGARLGTVSVKSRSVSRNGNPGVSDLFTPAELIGLNEMINYFVPGLEFWFDNRDDQNFPSEGGRYAISFSRYQALNVSNVSYNQYNAQFVHSIPLWRPNVVLTLQNKWDMKQTIGNDRVPFDILTKMDYSSPLRGFSGGRFHDRSSVVFNVEYRYPIWNVLYGVLFFDTGKVFRRLDSFDFDNFRFVGGGGFRFHYKDRALFNLDIGYGGEGVKVIFGIKKML